MKKSTYLIALAFGASTTTFAQNLGINTDGNDPDANTLLHLNNDAGSSLDSALLRIENEKATTGTGVQIENSGTASSKWDIIVPGSSTDLRIKGNGSDHVTIQNDGDVGIGTTSPSSLLHIAKTSIDNSIQDQLLLECHNNVSGNGNSIYFKNRWSSGSKWGMARIKAIEQTGYGGQLVFETNNGSGTADETTVEAMRIDENQRVGIGTTAPDRELHITGHADGGGDGVLRLTPFGTRENFIAFDEDDTGTGTADWYIGVEKNPGSGFGIYQNTGGVLAEGEFRIFIDKTTSHVGIGSNVFDPAEMLHVVGNGMFTGTVTASCGILDCSDKRYKKDFNKIGSALDIISQVDGYTYNFRTNEFPNLNFDSTQQVGFIAQELQEVLPEVVHQNDSGYLSINYGKVTPLLLMAIKEQQAIIDAQKKEIETQKAELKSKDDELKAELDSKTSDNAEEIESLKAQVQQLLQLIQQQESASVTD